MFNLYQSENKPNDIIAPSIQVPSKNISIWLILGNPVSGGSKTLLTQLSNKRFVF